MTGLASLQSHDRADDRTAELSELLKNIGRVKIQISTLQGKTGGVNIQRQTELRAKLDQLLAEYTQVSKEEVPKVTNAQARELPEDTEHEKELELPASPKQLPKVSSSEKSPASEEEPPRVLQQELPVPEVSPVPEQDTPQMQQPESSATEEEATNVQQQDIGEPVGEMASASKTLAAELQGGELPGELQEKETQEPPALLEQLPLASFSEDFQAREEEIAPMQQQESAAPTQQEDIAETPETAEVRKESFFNGFPAAAEAVAAAEKLQQELEEEALRRAAAASTPKAPVPEQAAEVEQPLEITPMREELGSHDMMKQHGELEQRPSQEQTKLREKQPSKKIQSYKPVKQLPWGFGATAKNGASKAASPKSPRLSQPKVNQPERAPQKQSPQGRAQKPSTQQPALEQMADGTINADQREQATVAEAASGEAEAFELCSPIDSLHTGSEDCLLPHSTSMVSSVSSWGKLGPTPGPSSSAGHGAMERRALQLAKNVKAAQDRCLDGKLSTKHLQAAEAEVATLRHRLEVRMQRDPMDSVKVSLQSPALSRDRSRSPDSSPARSPTNALRLTLGDMLPQSMKPQDSGEGTAHAVHRALFPQQSCGSAPSSPSSLSLSQRCKSLRLSSQSLATGASAKRSSSSSPKGSRRDGQGLGHSPGFGTMSPSQPRTGSPPRKQTWSPPPEKPRPARKSKPVVEERRPAWDDRWHLIEVQKPDKKSSLKEASEGQNDAKANTKSSLAGRAQRPRSASPTAQASTGAQATPSKQPEIMQEPARKRDSLMLRVAAVSPHSKKASSRRSSPKGQERVSKRLQEQTRRENEQMLLAAKAAAASAAAALSPRSPAVPAGRFAAERAQRQAVAGAEFRSR